MIIHFHKQFEKQLKKMNKKQQNIIKNKLKIFLLDPYQVQLNNHSLSGKYKNYRSINISGDLRMVFKLSDDGEEAFFVVIGNHNQLYS
ncbi:MAG TPA: hypothetical protein DEB09_05330 [Candidatus Magasanikbacteria bacterium]|nr:hypothetical protein [Candidatus Magasanikbacteria bacterium]